jgi:glucose/arabinose dehydrogenase
VRVVLLLVCALSVPVGPLHAQTVTTNPATSSAGTARGPRVDARLERIASVTGGTSLAWRRGDPIPYLALQAGQVVPLVGGKAGPPVLDVGDRLARQREQGLLGLAFSPDGRRLYVYLTASTGEDVLEEYPVDDRGTGPVRVDAAGRRVVLAIPHPGATHNGGQIAFGADGMLYLSVGDGGGHKGEGPGQVPGGNSQSLDTLLGKIVRIDPTPSGDLPYTVPADNPFAAGGGRPEIWHYGLRNPWRFSFDRATGDLWIGDVGQDHWEEVDVVPGDARGLDFGYPLLEGTHPLQADTAPGTVAPVYELWHRSGNCAITGGFVYRGRSVPELRGHYLFIDYCRGDLKAIRVEDGAVTSLAKVRLGAPLVSSFGEDADGELFLVSQADGVLRLTGPRHQGT